MIFLDIKLVIPRRIGIHTYQTSAHLIALYLQQPYLSKGLTQSRKKTMDIHKKAVDVIAADVRGFYERNEPFRIYHGATNSTRQSTYRKDRIIDTRSLSNVLEVDKERKTALVEPNVSMDQLVEVTMEHGLVPPVVMELPGITVGGFYIPFTNFIMQIADDLILQVVLREQPERAVPSNTGFLTAPSTGLR